MKLQTARLVLREFDPGDVSTVLAYQSDRRYLRHTPWTTRSDADVRDFVEMMVSWATEDPRTKFQLAVTHDGVLIGNCGVRKLGADPPEAEYGCELAPSAWGRGYAEEASRALLSFAFESLNLHRIVANTTTGNGLAIALALRLGFREEAHRLEHVQIGGLWQETVVLALHAREWKPRPNETPPSAR
jgi:ribosomal-protein-alanine N-acetyltransferase